MISYRRRDYLLAEKSLDQSIPKSKQPTPYARKSVGSEIRNTLSQSSQ